MKLSVARESRTSRSSAATISCIRTTSETVKRAVALQPDADVIQPGVDIIDEKGRAIRPLVDRVKQQLLTPRRNPGVVSLRGEEMATSLIRGDWLYWPSLTFRTDTLKRIDFREACQSFRISLC